MKRLRAPSLESLFAATLVLLGFRVGVLPISDNSMLSHLRTGIDIVATGGIPRTDPYSYTAAGTDWVVQSWLPEWTYGWAERLGGFRLVVLEQAVLLALLAWLMARLARSGAPLRTAMAAGLAVGIGAPFWSPRPLLFGLLCMALTVTVVERRRTPWLLVPIVWLWVNSHGSFPLGLVWLGTRAAGEWLDWKDWPRETVRYITGFLGSLLVAVVNPLGARLIIFPLTLVQKSEAFEKIVEWQSPNFHQAGNRFALICLAVVVVLMFRARLTWRDAVPAMVFVVLSLYSLRNFPVLAIVLAPILARILKRPETSGRRPPPTQSQPRVNRMFAATIGAAFAIFAILAIRSDPLDLATYPVEAAEFLDTNNYFDGSHRLAHQDAVGNFLSFRYGRSVPVFFDDRLDMYPVRLSEDYATLLTGGSKSLSVLNRYRVDVVLWESSLPLASQLRLSQSWTEVFRDDDWVVYERTAYDAGA